MAKPKNAATPTTLTAEQHRELEDKLYTLTYGCISLRVLIAEMRAIHVPVEGESGIELGVTMGALTDAMQAASERAYEILEPEPTRSAVAKAESEAANG